MQNKKGKNTNLIQWGNNHKLYIKNNEKAKLYAYHKAFYFETLLNGKRVDRAF